MAVLGEFQGVRKKVIGKTKKSVRLRRIGFVPPIGLFYVYLILFIERFHRVPICLDRPSGQASACIFRVASPPAGAAPGNGRLARPPGTPRGDRAECDQWPSRANPTRSAAFHGARGLPSLVCLPISSPASRGRGTLRSRVEGAARRGVGPFHRACAVPLPALRGRMEERLLRVDCGQRRFFRTGRWVAGGFLIIEQPGLPSGAERSIRERPPDQIQTRRGLASVLAAKDVRQRCVTPGRRPRLQ